MSRAHVESEKNKKKKLKDLVSWGIVDFWAATMRRTKKDGINLTGLLQVASRGHPGECYDDPGGIRKRLVSPWKPRNSLDGIGIWCQFVSEGGGRKT